MANDGSRSESSITNRLPIEPVGFEFLTPGRANEARIGLSGKRQFSDLSSRCWMLDAGLAHQTEISVWRRPASDRLRTETSDSDSSAKPT